MYPFVSYSKYQSIHVNSIEFHHDASSSSSSNVLGIYDWRFTTLEQSIENIFTIHFDAKMKESFKFNSIIKRLSRVSFGIRKLQWNAMRWATQQSPSSSSSSEVWSRSKFTFKLRFRLLIQRPFTIHIQNKLENNYCTKALKISIEKLVKIHRLLIGKLILYLRNALNWMKSMNNTSN